MSTFTISYDKDYIPPKGINLKKVTSKLSPRNRATNYTGGLEALCEAGILDNLDKLIVVLPKKFWTLVTIVEVYRMMFMNPTIYEGRLAAEKIHFTFAKSGCLELYSPSCSLSELGWKIELVLAHHFNKAFQCPTLEYEIDKERDILGGGFRHELTVDRIALLLKEQV